MSFSGRLILWICCGFLFASCNRPSGMLNDVDTAVRDADYFQQKIALRIDSAENVVLNLTDTAELFESHLKLAEICTSFDLDKALYHIKEAKKLSESKHIDDVDRTTVGLRLASLYNSQAGMIKDAWEMFSNLSDSTMSEENRLAYYILGVQINKSLSKNAIDDSLRETYLQKVTEFRDSVVKFGKDNPIIEARQLQESDEFAKAIERIKKELPDTITLEKGYAPLYHTLARILLESGQNEEEALKYLCAASVNDLQNGTREYKALTDLAIELMRRGDVRRAHTYIHRAQSDAKKSGARGRLMEVNSVVASIDAAYERSQERRTLNALIAIGFIFILLIVLLIAFIIVRKKNNLLKASGKKLSIANENLTEFNNSIRNLNSKLARESNIKEDYIKVFMNLCLNYLNKMESYRADLGKIAAKADWATLSSRIKSSRYVNHDIEIFYGEVDHAFLTLYPNFIRDLNKLLREEEQYENTPKLSTDLRIYALILLGIDSSGDIAKFLRISESTVYNYRTKMRNKAINRESFEEDFKNSLI